MDAMRRATKATQSGNPLDATRVIQQALSGNPSPEPAPSDDFDGVTIDGTVEGTVEKEAGARQADGPVDIAPMLSQSYSGPAGARDYRLFLPPTAPDGVRGLILMLHGCTQGPDDFARGTAMNAIAAREGLAVAYPGQTSAHNANGCWNWFEPSHQRNGAGEPAILAGLAQDVAATHGVPQGAIYAAGLSAGGAMAAILGGAYPEVFAAVGVHSGLPAGSARDVGSAFAAMSGGAGERATTPFSGKAHARMMVVHGARDRTVVPDNGRQLFDAMSAAFPDARPEAQPEDAQGATRTRLVRPDGTVVAERWNIAALGHAWSGGDPSGSYTAPRKPDASEGFVQFFLHPKS